MPGSFKTESGGVKGPYLKRRGGFLTESIIRGLAIWLVPKRSFYFAVNDFRRDGNELFGFRAKLVAAGRIKLPKTNPLHV